MAISTGTLGALLQGVSQQDARVRLEGQVTEQVNLLSDPTRNLTTRTGTRIVSTLSTVNPGYQWHNVRYKGKDYLLANQPSAMLAWEIGAGTSTPIPVDYFSSSNSYLGSSMRFNVVDGVILALNRNREVQIIDNTLTQNRFLGVISVRGGQFSRTYRIRIEYSNGAVVNVSDTTPDGTNPGDGLASSTDQIASRLHASIMAHPDLPSGGETGRAAHDLIAIFHPTLSFRITVGDGQGGDLMRAVTDQVRDVSMLPNSAPNGMLVEVRVSRATEDNYWMRFNAKGVSSTSGLDGFWREGIWEESRNPYDDEAFNLTTMPHSLTLGTDGRFKLRTTEWLPRQVGDADSAPLPSIVGKTIRDTSGFEGRLVLLTKDSVVMSRTNHPFDLWRESATVISASDPIDMSSTKKDDLSLDWLVPFDRDMFVVEDPGSSQFVIRGGGIEPSNASMVLTTEYEVNSAGAYPASTGRTLLLPFTVGNYSGLSEFYTNPDNSAQSASTITEAVSRYIPGEIHNVVVSQTFNLALVLNQTQEVYVYKYLWDGSELLQSAWSKWVFRNNVRHAFFVSSRLYMVIDSAFGPVLEVMDMNNPDGEYGYPWAMDSLFHEAAVAETSNRSSVTSPVFFQRAIQHTGCAHPGMVAGILSEQTIGSTRKYFFSRDEVPVGATVIMGRPIEWSISPTQVFGRDYQNRIDTSKNVTIMEYTVEVLNSGSISAEFSSKYYDNFVIDEIVYPLDGEVDSTAPEWTMTGNVVFPWGERADWSSLRIFGNDHKPVTILEVAWAGQILAPRGVRR